jgi:hypothetical protein
VGTANIGSRAPAYPPFYCGTAREGVHCHTRQAPPIRARIGSVSRSRDPKITCLTFSPLISISYLYLDNSLIHKSVHRANCIMTVSYVLSDTMTMIHLLFQNRFLSRPLYIQNHSLSLKPMPAKCSLNTLGGKSFVSGSAIIFLVLICSRLIV